MSVIALKGMRFYAYHGFYEEEQLLGSEFIVDVLIETNFSKAATDDDLYQTVNYETVYLICKTAMKENSRLLETVANRIAHNIWEYFISIKNLKVKVRLKKLHPPMGGRIENAWVEVEK